MNITILKQHRAAGENDVGIVTMRQMATQTLGPAGKGEYTCTSKDNNLHNWTILLLYL